MVHRVDVPHAVVVVGNIDKVGRHVERALVAGQVVLAVAVVVLKVDVRAAVDHAQIARAQALFELVVAAVEDDHVRVRDLFHHELTHVLDEQLERRRLHERHDLIEHPVGGQHLAVELFHLPHAVVLNEHLLGAVLLSSSLQKASVSSSSSSTVTTVTLSSAFFSYSSSPSSQQIRSVLSSRAKPSSKMPLIKLVLPESRIRRPDKQEYP